MACSTIPKIHTSGIRTSGDRTSGGPPVTLFFTFQDLLPGIPFASTHSSLKIQLQTLILEDIYQAS